MKQLWGDGNHQREIDDLLKEQALKKTKSQITPLNLLRDKSLRWQLYFVVSLVLSVQLSGVNAIYFYSYDVLRTAGFSPEEIPYLTLGTGTSEAIATVLCGFLIERMGRKTLLLSGYGLMASMLGLLTVSFSLKDHYNWIPYCSIMLVFLFLIFYGTCIGVNLSIRSEIITQPSRAATFVITGCLNWVGIYLIALIFPFIVESMGQFCFLIFLGCILSSWIFIFLFLPETRNKSSLEIMVEFNKLNFGSDNIHSTSENPQEASEKYSEL